MWLYLLVFLIGIIIGCFMAGTVEYFSLRTAREEGYKHAVEDMIQFGYWRDRSGDKHVGQWYSEE